MTIWKLNQGADRRIRARHPWVFSNELSQSPKGHPPGHAVRLVDNKGQFVASGYGNPHQVEDPTAVEELVGKVMASWGQRQVAGYRLSFRLIYGESDFLPGLVIDRYLVDHGGRHFQVFACQILTAGMQVSLAQPEKFFRRLVEEANQSGLSEIQWDETAIVLRNDVQIRRLEGLEIESPKVLKALDFDLQAADILLDPVKGEEPIKMTCDLVEGQKTGFFLDQAFNIRLLCEQLSRNQYLESPVRILDLCCYVGQWSTQLARTLKSMDVKVEVTAVDVSKPALHFAEKNISREGAQVFIQEKNVLEELNSLPDKHYDIVIADPPAFIKAKKDIPTGRHAYLKLNTSAFRLVKRGGYVVSCSCSGLLEEREFMDTLAKAIRRQELEARCLSRGGHAADHPNIMSFPEGFYLKMFLHQVAF
jgi:23S rRNA (cytosine1962-C5)-methyltransferase